MGELRNVRTQYDNNAFWDELAALELRHQSARELEEGARRRLREVARGDKDQLAECFRNYCEAVRQLDCITQEIEQLRTRSAV